MISLVPLAVTTAVKPPPELEEQARRLARDLQAPYAPRRNSTVAHVFVESGAERLLLAGRDGLALRDRATGQEYRFHPNLAPLRGLNIQRGWRDLFAEAAGLEPGGRLLDCTLGFGGEATLGALLTGETGVVVGLESVPELALVTREGLVRFPLPQQALRDAMGRVQVVTADYRDFLPGCETGSFDVVYFDPFFGERLAGSEASVSPLAVFGNRAPLHSASVSEARRVARRRVVVKHRIDEPLPEALAAPDRVVSGRRSRFLYSIWDR